MKAAVLTAPYEITVEKRGMPQIQGPQDVLFKILQTGICGSDMLAFRGGINRAISPSPGARVCR